ncbi:MAG TPA: class F sortase, partial [Geodermatophilus sp.]|nr:class F sortase [Geodermatophilus sp.]
PALLPLVLVLLAVGLGAVALLVPGSVPPADAAPVTGAGPVVPAARAPAARVVPVRVQVPAVGVDSGLVDLGLDAAGALEAPSDSALAGWYARGPVPGEVGPAVLVGHVDSRLGPAVFFRLRELAAGDEVVVDRSDGTSARFVVDRVEQHPKDAFPTAAVYGPTADAQLRLVTCGGGFDRSARSYEDNVVVFAHAVP